MVLPRLHREEEEGGEVGGLPPGIRFEGQDEGEGGGEGVGEGEGLGRGSTAGVGRAEEGEVYEPGWGELGCAGWDGGWDSGAVMISHSTVLGKMR